MKKEIEKIKEFLQAYGYGNELANVSDCYLFGSDYVDPPHLPQPHTITDPFGYSPVVLPHVVPQPLEPQPVGPQSVGPHPVVPPGFRPGPVVPPVIPHGPPPAQAPGP